MMSRVTALLASALFLMSGLVFWSSDTMGVDANPVGIRSDSTNAPCTIVPSNSSVNIDVSPESYYWNYIPFTLFLNPLTEYPNYTVASVKLFASSKIGWDVRIKDPSHLVFVNKTKTNTIYDNVTVIEHWRLNGTDVVTISGYVLYLPEEMFLPYQPANASYLPINCSIPPINITIHANQYSSLTISEQNNNLEKFNIIQSEHTTLLFKIYNGGNENDTARFSVVNFQELENVGISIELPSDLSLFSGEYATVEIKIKADSNVRPGPYHIRIAVESAIVDPEKNYSKSGFVDFIVNVKKQDFIKGLNNSDALVILVIVILLVVVCIISIKRRKTDVAEHQRRPPRPAR